MDLPKQQTIAAEFKMAGIGIHSGKISEVTFKPIDSGGIRFKRMDIEGHPEFPAQLDLVTETDRGTNLGMGELRVMTIEHVMGTLMGLEVDHVVIELSGCELPILDGSFQPYCEAILAVGLERLSRSAEFIYLSEPLEVVGHQGTIYRISPSLGLGITAQIDFKHRSIGVQSGGFQMNPDTFRSAIAPARTFGFESEVERLNHKGLALGASFDNAVVLGDKGVINGGLRFEDEFLRHKIGDILGDLALIGKRIRANIVCEKPGHEGNIKMAKSLKDKVKLNV